MKFGKQLEVCELPKFRGNYIQYKQLKKALKVLTGQEKDTSTVEDVTHWTSSFLRLGPNPELPPEARLNEVLTRELERVSRVVDLEQSAIRTELNSLVQDIKRGGDVAAYAAKLEELGEDIVSLKSFSQMNFSGFRKILKKYDKWSQKSTSAWYMSQVVKAPLMTADYEGLLQSLNEIASTLRQKGVLPKPAFTRKISIAELGPPDASRELHFLIDVKDTMRARVQLALNLNIKDPLQQTPARPARVKTNSVFFDTKDLSVYSAHVVGVPSDEEKGAPCDSVHIRRCDAGPVSSIVCEAKNKHERMELLLGKDDVANVLRAQAPRTLLNASSPGAAAVAGAVAPVENRLAMTAVQQVQQATRSGLAPVAQASYLRSILREGSGVTAVLDEDIRIAKVQKWDETGANFTDFFPYNVLTVIYPPQVNAADTPIWLQKIYDTGILLQVSGFSKAVHSIARFHGLEMGLPAPHWYHNVLSSGRLTEENEPPPSGEPSEGSAKGGGIEEVATESAKPTSHQGWTKSSVRLLHEFGTTPQEEEDLASRRQALSVSGAEFTEAAADSNSLVAPLLAGSSTDQARSLQPAAAAPGFFQRLFAFGGEDTDLDKPVRRAIVAVQPKTLYSNERTFLEWIHFATVSAAAGVFMLHATGERAHVLIGRVLILASIFLIVWAMRTFNWRADGLDFKVDMHYEDNVGPVVLVGSVLGALLFSSLHAVGVLS